jgi:Coproporphyrinogen III oxidase and related Fe-S oxidoreductases
MKNSQIYQSYMYSYPHKTAYRELTDIQYSRVRNFLDKKNFSLYFHMPFCRTKCGYCNLFSVTEKREDYFSQYLGAMYEQIKQYSVADKKFQSIIFGGGTPLILSPENLERLLQIAPHLKSSNSCIETSPNDTTAEKLEILQKYNINRVSIGVQSFIDSELNTLKRAHQVDSARKALSLIKTYNFDCVNIDLIYGIPGQTVESFAFSLKSALEYSPDELFLYPLYIRKGTELFGNVTNEDTQRIYFFARDYLLSNGYNQISMRQFAKKKPENITSCGFENMLSIGCGGRSYFGNLHFCSPYATDRSACVRLIDNYIHSTDKTQILHGFILNQDEQKRRFIIKNLLCFKGISLSDYANIFNSSALEDFELLNELISNSYAEIKENFITLTPLGMSISDYIGPMFISDAVNEKMNEWTPI